MRASARGGGGEGRSLGPTCLGSLRACLINCCVLGDLDWITRPVAGVRVILAKGPPRSSFSLEHGNGRCNLHSGIREVWNNLLKDYGTLDVCCRRRVGSQAHHLRPASRPGHSHWLQSRKAMDRGGKRNYEKEPIRKPLRQAIGHHSSLGGGGRGGRSPSSLPLAHDFEQAHPRTSHSPPPPSPGGMASGGWLDTRRGLCASTLSPQTVATWVFWVFFFGRTRGEKKGTWGTEGGAVEDLSHTHKNSNLEASSPRVESSRISDCPQNPFEARHFACGGLQNS